jgi:hypothetical protein
VRGPARAHDLGLVCVRGTARPAPGGSKHRGQPPPWPRGAWSWPNRGLGAVHCPGPARSSARLPRVRGAARRGPRRGAFVAPARRRVPLASQFARGALAAAYAACSRRPARRVVSPSAACPHAAARQRAQQRPAASLRHPAQRARLVHSQLACIGLCGARPTRSPGNPMRSGL